FVPLAEPDKLPRRLSQPEVLDRGGLTAPRLEMDINGLVVSAPKIALELPLHGATLLPQTMLIAFPVDYDLGGFVLDDADGAEQWLLTPKELAQRIERAYTTGTNAGQAVPTGLSIQLITGKRGPVDGTQAALLATLAKEIGRHFKAEATYVTPVGGILGLTNQNSLLQVTERHRQILDGLYRRAERARRAWVDELKAGRHAPRELVVLQPGGQRLAWKRIANEYSPLLPSRGTTPMGALQKMETLRPIFHRAPDGRTDRLTLQTVVLPPQVSGMLARCQSGLSRLVVRPTVQGFELDFPLSNGLVVPETLSPSQVARWARRQHGHGVMPLQVLFWAPVPAWLAPIVGDQLREFVQAYEGPVYAQPPSAGWEIGASGYVKLVGGDPAEGWTELLPSYDYHGPTCVTGLDRSLVPVTGTGKAATPVTAVPKALEQPNGEIRDGIVYTVDRDGAVSAHVPIAQYVTTDLELHAPHGPVVTRLLPEEQWLKPDHRWVKPLGETAVFLVPGAVGQVVEVIPGNSLWLRPDGVSGQVAGTIRLTEGRGRLLIRVGVPGTPVDGQPGEGDYLRHLLMHSVLTKLSETYRHNLVISLEGPTYQRDAWLDFAKSMGAALEFTPVSPGALGGATEGTQMSELLHNPGESSAAAAQPDTRLAWLALLGSLPPSPHMATVVLGLDHAGNWYTVDPATGLPDSVLSVTGPTVGAQVGQYVRQQALSATGAGGTVLRPARLLILPVSPGAVVPTGPILRAVANGAGTAIYTVRTTHLPAPGLWGDDISAAARVSTDGGMIEVGGWDETIPDPQTLDPQNAVPFTGPLVTDAFGHLHPLSQPFRWRGAAPGVVTDTSSAGVMFASQVATPPDLTTTLLWAEPDRPAPLLLGGGGLQAIDPEPFLTWLGAGGHLQGREIEIVAHGPGAQQAAHLWQQWIAEVVGRNTAAVHLVQVSGDIGTVLLPGVRRPLALPAPDGQPGLHTGTHLTFLPPGHTQARFGP
ncbi:hypothetical protein ACWGI8_42495, partial [Streptomyces sp. NPDC054841]